MEINVKWLSALEKVFPDAVPEADSFGMGSALRGEKYHVQLAFTSAKCIRDELRVEIHSELKDRMKMFEVRFVPVCLTHYSWADDNYLRKTPGIYPDLLTPVDGNVTVVEGQWRSLWFEIDIPEDLRGGRYNIEVSFTHYKTGERLAETAFQLDVIEAILPPQRLIHTEWFHNDCLASYYQVPVFSEAHWEIIANYMRQAAEYGVNMILTPVFTPPIDTAVGGERPTVQLVDVVKQNGEYTFAFDRLERYIDTATQAGMRYFEISHLFTQWGAKAAPKVIVREDGVERRLFGWDTPSDSPEYITFLRQFLPALKGYLSGRNLLDRCYFHISDEPNEGNIASYTAAKGAIDDLLTDCHVVDALSDYRFYEQGIIKNPIPTNAEIEEFIQKGLQHRWTYYCGDLCNQVSNRAMAMPSQRNRIIGLQMFKYRIEGFLHWGYNFWYNWLSQKPVNPFFCTDAKDTFTSGDAYLVYPGEDRKPLPSIRQMVFYDALQDIRACELLSEQIGFERTVGLLNDALGMDYTFKDYPHDAASLLRARERINRELSRCLQNAQEA